MIRQEQLLGFQSKSLQVARYVALADYWPVSVRQETRYSSGWKRSHGYGGSTLPESTWLIAAGKAGSTS